MPVCQLGTRNAGFAQVEVAGAMNASSVSEMLFFLKVADAINARQC